MLAIFCLACACAPQGQPSGNLELIVFAPEFLKEHDPPRCLVLPAEGFTGDMANTRIAESLNIQLIDSPSELPLPTLIEDLAPGDYYVGVRAPVRTVIQGDPPEPVTYIETLAWDGPLDAGIRANRNNTRMYHIRWYLARIEPDQTTLVSALFFPIADDVNAQLDEAAQMKRYPVQLGIPPQTEQAYGVDPTRLEDLLVRSGKVFIPKGFIPNKPDYEAVWFLPETSAGKVKIFARRIVPQSDIPTTNSLVQ